LPEAWEWITKKIFCRLVITDKYKTVWEGRLEDVGLTEGSVSVTAYGYYANLSDIPYTTAYNDNFDVVIKAVLTANCAQISSDQSNIDATGGPAITSAAASSYLDIYPKQIVEKLANFSDTTYNSKWYFAIWEDRVPYLKRVNVSTVNYKVGLGDFSRFLLKHRGADLWNSCYAVYDDGGIARTATVNDVPSQEKYGDGTTSLIRRKVIPSLGAVAQAAAQSARDGWLKAHKDVWPKLENMVLGQTVYDTSGFPVSSSWVRAGEVIRIQDLVPASTDLDAVERDALRTYYIVETEYDMDRAELRIVPDTEGTLLTSILARKI